jgi:hypothetical protein
MATPTYDLLASSVLASSASSVTFSSISQDYRDLVLVCEGEATETRNFQVRLNGDTSASNGTSVSATGTGSSAVSQTLTFNYLQLSSYAVMGDGTRALWTAQFFDYSATDKHKSVLARANSSATEMFAGRWANTAAITSIEVFWISTGNFKTGSTFYLYGIAS